MNDNNSKEKLRNWREHKNSGYVQALGVFFPSTQFGLGSKSYHFVQNSVVELDHVCTFYYKMYKLVERVIRFIVRLDSFRWMQFDGDGS